MGKRCEELEMGKEVGFFTAFGLLLHKKRKKIRKLFTGFIS